MALAWAAAPPLAAEQAAAPSRPEPRRPSVLVHCARSALAQWGWWVDLEYLAELRSRGFEVDYTDLHSDLTWERLRRYDVLVTYVSPLERGRYYDNTPALPPYRDEFIELVERFLDHGGGVMLMARALNADETFRPLIEPWGARIAHERIVDDDPDHLVVTPRMGGRHRLWFTDGVLDGPVTAGVDQVWLPLTPHYSAFETMPIVVSDAWQVVLRGGARSRTVPIEAADERMLPFAGAYRRPKPDDPPDLFAIRSYRRGRLALCAIWPHYSIGQGTAWLFDRRVLSRGVDDRPSHFGRLVENTLGWLAAGDDRDVGGFRGDAARLVAPNERPGVRRAFLEREHGRDADPRRAATAATAGLRTYRGLIGAATTAGGGPARVADHAAAARRSGLDFVVFLEPFEQLAPGDLERLHQACRDASGDGLQLFAGYRIETNTGNRLFVFGREAELPPAELRIGERLNQQPQDPRTLAFVGGWPKLIDWIGHRLIPGRGANVGYYGLADRPQAQRATDLRLYGMLAVELYRDGERLEDNLDVYLATAAGSIPPVPVAVHLVDSPRMLERAAREGIGLTHVGARSEADLWEALRYHGQDRAPNVYPSSGPEIVAWPDVFKYYTLAAEDFSGASAYMPAPLVVRADTGLHEIRIYDGERLFRRFDPRGETELSLVLELPGSIERTLTVVAEDATGGRAVSTARRNWKNGDLAPVFCGDRINHCDPRPMLAKGPGSIRVLSTPEIDAGFTWDGGPRGSRPLIEPERALRPRLVGELGHEGDRGFANTPRLVLADEGAVRVRSTLDTRFADEVPVINAWRTFGPLGGPSRLLRAEQHYTEFDRPTLGADPYRHPGYGRRGGASVSLFETEVTFLAGQTIERYELFVAPPTGDVAVVHVVHGRGEREIASYRLSDGDVEPRGARLERGDWIAFYADGGFNTAVQFNRGEPLDVELDPHRGVVYRHAGGPFAVREGERRRFELLSAVDPLDHVPGGAERAREIVRFLLDPLGDGPGGPAPSAGVIELDARDGTASIDLERSSRVPGVPLPVVVSGLNPNWSAGVLLERGYVLGGYGSGADRYRAAAVDPAGRLYLPLFPDLAPRTSVVAGHPVVCDRRELFIQVTLARDRPAPGAWHVSINNPLHQPVRTTVRVVMPMVGLAAGEREVVVPAGGYLVLEPVDFSRTSGSTASTDPDGRRR
ncbi:MAG TPA: hypothetical protein VD788_07425 [Candidatus Polarisedimenticolaceae bacterium]|nr:hypothetical protein [Candidatus Polarisedimenticolaceae bacterium]